MASVVDQGAGQTSASWMPSSSSEVRVPAAPRRRRGRLPASLGVAVVAGLMAMLFTLAAGRQDDAVQVTVAAQSIRAGERIEAGDLRYADISGSASVLSSLVRRIDARSLIGQVATQPIAAGTMVSTSDVAPEAGPGQQRAMSFAVDVDRAVGGAIRAGDRIDVIDGSVPSYVLVDAEVLAVAQPATGALATRRNYAITVAVDAESALRLAAAIQAGKLELVRATGAPAIAAPAIVPAAGIEAEAPAASAEPAVPIPVPAGG